MNDDPAFLSVGTDVSAKYKGAFCEAKIKKVVKNIKCRVTLKGGGGGSLVVPDDAIKGTLRVGNTVEVRHDQRKESVEAILTKIQDCSQYTVVFDDGDITTLRRSALCLKSGRHFADGETLDQLPLTHPEHFSSPVIGHSAGRRGRRTQRTQSEDSYDGGEGSGNGGRNPASKSPSQEKEPHTGRVVLVECSGGSGDRRRSQHQWFPGLVVAPTAQDTVKIRIKDDYLVRSFKDGRYYTVPKKEAREFKKGSGPQEAAGMEAALQYLNSDILPPHWDRDVLFGTDQIGKNDDANSDDSSDDEPREEKDHFVAQLYKFMDDRGTPLNRQPTIANKDVDLYRLFKVVHKLGGFNRVTNQNQWRMIATKLGFQPATTSVTNLCKQAYKKNLHSFEEFYRKLGVTLVAHPRGSRNPPSGRSLIRDRDRAPPPASAAHSQSPGPSVCGATAATVPSRIVQTPPVDAKSEIKTELIEKVIIEKSSVPLKLREEVKMEKMKTEKVIMSDEDDSGDSKPLAATRSEKSSRICKPTEKALLSKAMEKQKTEKLTKSDRSALAKASEKATQSKAGEKTKTSEKASTGKMADKAPTAKPPEKEVPKKAEQSSLAAKPLERSDRSGSCKSLDRTAPSKSLERSGSSKSLERTGSSKSLDRPTPSKSLERSNSSKSLDKVTTVTKSTPQNSIAKKIEKKSKSEVAVKEESSENGERRRRSISKREGGRQDPSEDSSLAPKPKRRALIKDRRNRSSSAKRSTSDKERTRTTASSENQDSDSSSRGSRSGSKLGRRLPMKRKSKLPTNIKVAKRKSTETADDEVIDLPTPGTIVSADVGDRLKVYYGPTLDLKVTYEAKVIEVRDRDGDKMLRVHYTGWNIRYDEWIKPARIAVNLTQYAKSKHKDGSGGKKARFAGSNKVLTRNKNASSPPTNPPVSGRDFDMHEIRSELKGFEKAVKSPPSAEDTSIKVENEEAERPERDAVVAMEDADPIIAEIKREHDDIYEFKEPEPFEFEVRKSDESKKRPQAHILFDDLPPDDNTSPEKSPQSVGRSSSPEKNFDEEFADNAKSAEEARDRVTLTMFSESAEEDSGDRLVISEAEDSREPLFTYQPDLFPAEKTYMPTFKGFGDKDGRDEFSKPGSSSFDTSDGTQNASPSAKEEQFSDEDPINAAIERVNSQSISEDTSDDEVNPKPAHSKPTSSVENDEDDDPEYSNRALDRPETPTSEPRPADADSAEPKSPVSAFEYKSEPRGDEETAEVAIEEAAVSKSDDEDARPESPKADLADKSDSDVDVVIPEPPAGFLLHKESIADKVLKALSNAKKAVKNSSSAEDPADAPTSVDPPKEREVPTAILEYSKTDAAQSCPASAPEGGPNASRSASASEAHRGENQSTPTRGVVATASSERDEEKTRRNSSPPVSGELDGAPSDLSLENDKSPVPRRKLSSGGEVSSKNNVLSETILKLSTQISMPTAVLPDTDDDTDDSFDKLIIDRAPSDDDDSAVGSSSENEPTPENPESAKPDWTSPEQDIFTKKSSRDGAKSTIDKQQEEDSNISLLLCEETIPGSPAPEGSGSVGGMGLQTTGGAGLAGAGSGRGSRGGRVPRAHNMPFASAPYNSPPKEQCQQMSANVALPTRVGRAIANHEAPNHEERQEEIRGDCIVASPDSSDGSVMDDRAPSEHSEREEEEEEEQLLRTSKKVQRLDSNKPLSAWRRRKASSDEDMSPSTGTTETPGASVGPTTAHARRGRRPRRTSEAVEPTAGPSSGTTLVHPTTSSLTANSHYNFLVDFGTEDLPSSKKIAIITQRMADLSRTYNSFKAELMAIDRRRKKLRRKEREG